MFKDNEIIEYEKMLINVGIIERNEQKVILEFLYTLGGIIYESKI